MFTPQSSGGPYSGHWPPVLLVLLLLVLGMFVGSLAGTLSIQLASHWKGIELSSLLAGLNESSPLADRQFVRWANLIAHLLTFTGPALGVVIFFYRRQWPVYLGLRRRLGAGIGLLAVFFILSSFPLAQLLYWVNKQLPLPVWMAGMEDTATGMVKGLLVMETPGELLVNLLVVAVLPAVGEELVFRGVLQQQLERLWRSPHPAVWVTAMMFSAVHMQFEGFLPRMILGGLLGYLFLWSRSLWLPVLGHFAFNGSQVLATYFFADQIAALEPGKVPEPNLWAAGISLLLVWMFGRAIKGLEPEKPPADNGSVA